MMLELLKRKTRLIEARFTPRVATVSFLGHQFRFLRSLWWDDTSPPVFENEISPYFQVLDRSKPISQIVDAGGATGQFAIVAAKLFPQATVHAFEPSERQRVMLKRNIGLNGVVNVKIYPFGLWREAGMLRFRTHGAISSLENVGTLPGTLAFEERVPVTTLDDWVSEFQIEKIDLIKMDIEGAEIEALQGATRVLGQSRPQLLLQAYHLREGQRTFEPCATLLMKFGYDIREVGGNTGFLHALPSHRHA